MSTEEGQSVCTGLKEGFLLYVGGREKMVT